MTKRPLILLVEDSPTIRAMVEGGLDVEGYDVDSAASAADLKKKLSAVKPDLVLLDVMLPDGDGLSLIQGIREKTDVPIIVVSGKTEMVDKVVGLEMGADDYVGKPVQMKELSARVKAQLRRYQGMKEQGGKASKKADARKIRCGAWVLDREKFQVFDARGNSANLTAKEYQLLEVLALGGGKVFSREELLDRARDGDHNSTDRAIDVQILRIRKKLNDNSNELIQSVRGIGYTMGAKTEILA